MKKFYILATVAAIALSASSVQANKYMNMDMVELQGVYKKVKRTVGEAQKNNEATEAQVADLKLCQNTFKYRKGIEENKSVQALLDSKVEADLDAFIGKREARVNGWFGKANEVREFAKTKINSPARQKVKTEKREKEMKEILKAKNSEQLAAKLEYVSYRKGKTEARAKRFAKKLGIQSEIK